MPRTATRPRRAEDAPPTASIITLLQAIERVGPDAPAALAFRSALRRKGAKTHAASGPCALDALQQEIATTDPARAESRAAILASVWSGFGIARP